MWIPFARRAGTSRVGSGSTDRHRRRFRYHWRWKSRKRGRRKSNPENVHLIRRMCRANPLCGAPRIHGELLELVIEISETTMAKNMIKPCGPRSQCWRRFFEIHASELIALGFFTSPTATFRVLFVLVVLSHDRRRMLQFNATEHPTAARTARQLLEACGIDESPAYLIRYREAIYGEAFHRQARALRIEPVPQYSQRSTHRSWSLIESATFTTNTSEGPPECTVACLNGRDRSSNVACSGSPGDPCA